MIALCLCLAVADYPVRPVPFTDVRVTSGFWAERQKVNRDVTIPFALQQCEDSNRVRNFDLAAETLRRRAAGDATFQNTPLTQYPFDDTDAYKAIEAASYVLQVERDDGLARRVDTWIARIAAAQEPDGYLYTFRTMHPDTPAHPWIAPTRWTDDPKLSHELYCAGHLYEAGAAHFQATGRRTLLDICIRNADLLWRDFGDGRLRIAPGHPIVEMGLVKLYRVTGDTRYLKLAQIFLDARGPGGPEYNQQQARVVDQEEAVGHAVRANYLYSGMADVAALTGDPRYVAAITKIWDNVVAKKLYLTGGVGARRKGEAYGDNYELPNDAYNETCAAVAMMMWDHRMFLLTGEARYMDVFERTAYNGFISGVSLSGDRFFYPNPLSYDGTSKSNNGTAGRAAWFGCACCPPNLMRMVASLTGYFYAVRGDDLYVNLYGASSGTAHLGGTAVGLRQETEYPWKGTVRLTVSPVHAADFALRLRIPGWAEGRPVPSDLYRYDQPGLAHWSLTVNGAAVPLRREQGYAVVRRRWQPGDVVVVDFALPVQTVRATEAVSEDRGRSALERGPVVYCFERGAAGLKPLPVSLVTLTHRGAPAIPYFAWNNRGLAPMEVWVRSSDIP